MTATAQASFVAGDRVVPWLDKMLPGLAFQPLKYLVQINARTLGEEVDPKTIIDYIDISSVDSDGFVIETTELTFGAAPSRARRVLRDGDVFISTVRTYLTAIAFCDARTDGFVCSTGFAVLTPSHRVVPRFLFYWARAANFVGEVVARSTGVSYPAINASEIGNLPFPLLALEHQQTISHYLDRKTTEIDALIASKRRMLDLLHEKRQALISEAVTRGLDPDVPTKDSGIEWMGQVPATWQLVKLKYVAHVQSGVTLGKKYGETPLVSRPYLRVANVQDGYLDLNEITTIDIPPDEAPRFELRPGDVLMTEGGDFDKLGRGYVWDGQIADCLHQNHVFAVRPNKHRLRSHFLSSLMTSAYGKNYFTSTAQQTTNLATTNSTKLGAFTLPVPPIKEQDQILAFLADSRSRLEGATQKLRVSIDKLLEYRRTLISAAVTGKLDVQEARS